MVKIKYYCMPYGGKKLVAERLSLNPRLVGKVLRGQIYGVDEEIVMRIYEAAPKAGGFQIYKDNMFFDLMMK